MTLLLCDEPKTWQKPLFICGKTVVGKFNRTELETIDMMGDGLSFMVKKEVDVT